MHWRAVVVVVVLLLVCAVSGAQAAAVVIHATCPAAEICQCTQANNVPSAVATATVSDDMETTGWVSLQIMTYNVTQQGVQVSDEQQSFAAGFVEACATATRIGQFVTNMRAHLFNTVDAMPSNVADYLWKNYVYVLRQSTLYGPSDAFWYQAGLLLSQVRGLQQGYASVADPQSPVLSLVDFLFVQAASETEDIMSHLNPQPLADVLSRMNEHELRDYTEVNGHCTSLIKITPDGSDLLVAQTHGCGSRKCCVCTKSTRCSSTRWPLPGPASACPCRRIRAR
eukprot:EC800195.1.p1 GENE.EC800195.1~~EC800195.1.p1  ORF type:complete len:283 (+),score=76.04 EC800195.1:19-867(+)